MSSFDFKGKIFVAGHRGMVGSAIVRLLKQKGANDILTRTSKELDLRNQADVQAFFKEHKPRFVVLAAAKVGGILANDTYRGEFLYDNMMIEFNVIEAARQVNVEKLLFLGSSCIYPKHADQPMREDALLTGILEPTNEPYAIAKIAGIKLCDAYRDQYGCDFISAMPTNLYGQNDNYDLKSSHVLPALMRKVIMAKANNEPEVSIWGSGTPLREFLHVDDLAAGCIHLLENFSGKGPINIGTGDEISIRELAETIASQVGYNGSFVYDTSKPDGTPRKLMDSSKLREIGWAPHINLATGVRMVLTDVQSHDWYPF